MGRKKKGEGPFLYILFHRQTSQRENGTGQSEQEQREEKETVLKQTANDSDVWFTLLFTSFAVACPFTTQHSLLSVQSSSAQWGPPLALAVLASGHLSRPFVCACVCELAPGLLVKL